MSGSPWSCSGTANFGVTLHWAIPKTLQLTIIRSTNVDSFLALHPEAEEFSAQGKWTIT
jgi:hypothetical protein